MAVKSRENAIVVDGTLDALIRQMRERGSKLVYEIRVRIKTMEELHKQAKKREAIKCVFVCIMGIICCTFVYFYVFVRPILPYQIQHLMR